MKAPYLEVMFRHGKPLAAYLYLPRQMGDRAVQSEPIGDVLVVDRAADGRPIGIEILDPAAVTVDQLNAMLRQLHQPELSPSELAPLQMA